ncbi:hypothetical protein SAV31267_043220 [Streptomyces avermitilis]|uniref:NADPH-dependent FMN reductase-like domain-containing protein n=1 Tax=Streptomyces avermitilis TaxID=33903 RepID=A0A4D4MUQ4_STRAX|nr:hypothetical protein SAV31267_043220 [Streptomyces avermitilis]
MPRRFLFVLGSSRSNGNTELLARAAAEQLPGDVEQQWISLAGHRLPDFGISGTTPTTAAPRTTNSRCCSTPPSPRPTW